MDLPLIFLESDLDITPEAVNEMLSVNEYLMDTRPYYFRKMDKEALSVVLELPGGDLDDMASGELKQRIASKKIMDADGPQGLISENTRKVANWLRLSPQESKLLRLAVLCHEVSMLNQLLGSIDNLNYQGCLELIARAIGEPVLLVARSLAAGSPLRRAGLFAESPASSSRRSIDPDDLLELQDGIAERINQVGFSAKSLLDNVAAEIVATDLEIADFEHIKEDVEILIKLLKSAKEARIAGVNILIYGPPGVGKSELASVLAAAANTQMIAVANEDEDGGPHSASSRRSCYLMLQYMARKTAADVVLIDEAEDLFDMMGGRRDSFSAFSRSASGGRQKAWWNKLLETNPLPTVWVSNSIHGLDPAYLRRFQYTLEMPHPSADSRKKIVRRCVGTLPLSDFAIESVAENDQLSAGDIKSAATLASYVGGENADGISRDFLRTLNGKLTAMGERKLKLTPELEEQEDALKYSLEYVNTNVPVDNVAEFLARQKEGRLLFYGAPGTGKSEFSRYLAKTLGVRLDVQRVSDILSKWHGGTEKNLARIFAEDNVKSRFLLIDEVDSLLFDRSMAEKSWEVSGVNEFLSQLESYRGMVACTTNRKDVLDVAVLRRFDLKVEFNTLKKDQLEKALADVLRNAGLTLNDELEGCSGLVGVTLGDIAAAQRAHRLFGGNWSVAEWLQRVGDECRIRAPSTPAFSGFARTS